jgi:hypothetical protein
VLLRSQHNPRAIIPGLTWNVAETAAHLVTALETYRELVLGTADARTMSVPEAETPDSTARATTPRSWPGSVSGICYV